MTKPKVRERRQKDKFDEENETVISMTQNRNSNNKRGYNNKTKKNLQSRSINQNKKIRRRKRAKKIAKVLMLFLIIIGGIVFALVSPLFNISKIEVLDNKELSAETVVSLSQLKNDQNIFKFVKTKVENNIKENAYVESVEIKRKLPNTIKIYVKERTRDYNLEFLNGYAYINKYGFILEISDTAISGLPIIKGASTDSNNIVVGNRLDSDDLDKMNTVIEIMNICKNYEISDKVTSIDISDKNNYILYLESEKKDVYLGDSSNLNNKILYIPTILKDNQGKEGIIYLNGDLNNNFKPRFREKV